MTDEAKKVIEAMKQALDIFEKMELPTEEREFNLEYGSVMAIISAFEQVTRERDAAVEDVKSLCATNYYSGNFCAYCKYNEPDGQCHHHCIPYSSEWGWQWRGVEVEG